MKTRAELFVLNKGHVMSMQATGAQQASARPVGLAALFATLVAFVGFSSALLKLVTRWTSTRRIQPRISNTHCSRLAALDTTRRIA